MRRVPLHSKSTAATMEEEEEEEEHLENSNNSSCYYPGCKKDANCSCEICLASINATLDLMPMSIHKSSLTKLSASKPNNNLECTPTPISFDASHLSTPKSTASHILPSSTPAIKSTARSSLVFNQNEEEDKKKGKQWCFTGLNILRILLGLGFLLCADIVFPKIVSGIIRPALSPELVKRVGEKCWHVQDLNGKLRFLQKELASVVDGKVSNCSHVHSLWKISKDGVLLNSRCTLYKSAIEEVTVWGWPLQTSGLLTTGFSSTTFTILSGRLSEWNGGHVSYLVRKANASWVQPKWGASVVQLHPNTWILQYQRSYCTRLHSAALDFLKSRISRIVGRVKKSFWMLAAVEDTLYNEFRANNGIKIPT